MFREEGEGYQVARRGGGEEREAQLKEGGEGGKGGGEERLYACVGRD